MLQYIKIHCCSKILLTKGKQAKAKNIEGFQLERVHTKQICA